MIELKIELDLARKEILLCVCVPTNLNLGYIRFESNGSFPLNIEKNARPCFNLGNINNFTYVLNNQLRRNFMFAGGETKITAVVTLANGDVINSNTLSLNQILENE